MQLGSIEIHFSDKPRQLAAIARNSKVFYSNLLIGFGIETENIVCVFENKISLSSSDYIFLKTIMQIYILTGFIFKILFNGILKKITNNKFG